MSRWSPYVNNGGTTLGVCGKDFAVVAADTRLSEGYSIASRYAPKIFRLTDKCVLATSGMQADAATLQKTIKIRLEMYQHQNGKQMSTPAIAQMLSNMLYYKRFFPYYTFNVLAGVDEQGVGCVYSYDAVGSYERVKYSSSGTGQTLTQPLLDNQVGKKNQQNVLETDLTVTEAEELVKDAFNSAGERDIYTGDHVDMYTITSEGAKYTRFDLKYD
eukprot:TRINITY_DN227_c0_g1_i1.p1 TRINITY_DN227_c0_g1~~TRINITY_DN227_c0_g1_i1.p1  ORF type:complete len:216 (+),score=58.20 TRINITY_DN227_c0_g1_i1:74-721(+)